MLRNPSIKFVLILILNFYIFRIILDFVSFSYLIIFQIQIHCLCRKHMYFDLFFQFWKGMGGILASRRRTGSFVARALPEAQGRWTLGSIYLGWEEA